jgi:hypothetical protein
VTGHHVHLQAAGVRVDLHPSWARYEDVGPTSGAVYQPVAATHGTVFVRYGSDATVDVYLAGLATGYPLPVLVSDQEWDLHGLPARRVQLVQERNTPPMATTDPTGPEHAPPAGRVVFVAVGCEATRLPVLTGYDVPETALDEVRDALEGIIASVRPDMS